MKLIETVKYFFLARVERLFFYHSHIELHV